MNIIILALVLITPSLVFAAPPSRVADYIPLTTITSSDVKANEDAIFTYLQAGVDTIKDGTIIDADIAASAAIDDTKIDLSSVAQSVLFAGVTEFDGVANFDNTVDIDGALYADSTIYFTQLPTTTESAPTLNGQLTNKAYVDGKFNTSTGHDHDGSDSKKVVATNLDMTGITSGHYLYNNSGTLAGASISFKAPFSFSEITSPDAATSYYTQQVIVPTSGVIKNLYAYRVSGNRDGTLTVQKNASDQSVTCNTSSGSCNDTSNNFSVVAGDRIRIGFQGTSGSTSTVYSVGLQIDQL